MYRLKPHLGFTCFFIFFSSTLIGCSDNPLSVLDTQWDCRKEKTGPICEVKFTLENSSHFPIAANALIRAHRRRTGGLGEVSNHLVGEKVLKFTIQPNERKEVEEILEVQGRATQIVVTAWGEKI